MLIYQGVSLTEVGAGERLVQWLLLIMAGPVSAGVGQPHQDPEGIPDWTERGGSSLQLARQDFKDSGCSTP